MGMLVTSGSDGLVLLMVKDRMPCCTEARMAETSASSGSDHERLKLPKRRSRCRDFWKSSPASCRFADIISAHDARLLRMTIEGKQAAVCTPVTHTKHLIAAAGQMAVLTLLSASLSEEPTSPTPS